MGEIAEVDLCAQLLLESFGEVVEQVGRLLMRHGPQRLGEILRATQLPFHAVRDALLILLHHNLVLSKDVAERKKVTYTYYSAVPRNILWRMQFARFVLCMRESYGEVAEMITREMLLHGRRTLEEVIDRGLVLLDPPLVDTLQDPPPVDHAADKTPEQRLKSLITEAFVRLTEQGFLVSVDHAEIIFGDGEMEPKGIQTPAPPPKGKGATRRGVPVLQMPELVRDVLRKRKRVKEEELSDTGMSEDAASEGIPPEVSEEAVRLRAARQAKKRRKLSDDLNARLKVEIPVEIAPPLSKSPLFSPGLPPVVPPGSLYRPNFVIYMKLLVHREVLGFVRQKCGETAAKIVDGVHKLSMPHEQPFAAVASAMVQVKEVYALLEGEVTHEVFLNTVDDLCREPDHFLARMGASSDCLIIDTPAILRMLRRRTVADIIGESLGEQSRRLFRVLCDKKMVDQKHVSEIAMLPPKEARERLYVLYRLSLVHVQEVPKAAERVPSKTAFLWHGSEPLAARALCLRLARTLTNVKQRLADVVVEEESLLNKLEANTTDEHEQRRAAELKRMGERLDAAMLQAAKAYAVLHEFE